MSRKERQTKDKRYTLAWGKDEVLGLFFQVWDNKANGFGDEPVVDVCQRFDYLTQDQIYTLIASYDIDPYEGEME